MEPARFVVEAVGRLDAEPGSAVDVAGGTGRHAIWLAGRGWRVTLVDGSPAALAMAVEDAAAAGVVLDVVTLDLRTDPLPGGPWDLVLIHHYLDRRLLGTVDLAMAPGAHLVWAQQTVLDTHGRPGSPYRVAIGEAATLLPGALEVISLVEGTTEGRHEAMLVARKPG